MARSTAELAQTVSAAVKGDSEAIREISDAIDSQDQARIRTVLHERAGVELTDEEMSAGLQDTDDVHGHGAFEESDDLRGSAAFT